MEQCLMVLQRRFFVEKLSLPRPCCKRRHGLPDRADVLGRGAAATTHNIDQPFFGKLTHQAAGDIRGFVKAGVTHGVG